MKINIIKSSFFFLFIVFLVACSTKKDTFLARNSHALSTKYNILYNGEVAFDKGVKTIKSNNDDDFWQLLPTEKMQIKEDINLNSKSSNADFELAESKATKAIQKHSMNIGGREKNSQIDEAYLMLGKARYYDQRFVPALDAFNYILYKYPNSSKIYEAKIWREKTNMRLGNDAMVIKNISKLLEDRKVKKQVFADANALLAASFLNLEQQDSAVAKLKLAVEFTKVNQEKARYRFILGQLYQELGYKDSAVAAYQSVIEMNRKAEREFVIQAHAKKSELFDYQNGDFIAFEKTFDKLIKDRENRPYKDLIFYHFGLFYDKQNNQKAAIELYNSSLRTNLNDTYLVASNYRNLGNIYFRDAVYSAAAKYYDSTLVKLNPKSREFIKIEKIRSNLDEVILYEAIVKRNDSILNIVALSPEARTSYFENYIIKLQKEDEVKRLLEEKNRKKQENIQRNNSVSNDESILTEASSGSQKSKVAPPSMNTTSLQTGSSTFYFYNPTTVAFGKLEFKKRWGDRALDGNWRMRSGYTNNIDSNSLSEENNNPEKEVVVAEIIPQYTADYYLEQLPTALIKLDSISKERNFAYYQLGIIYKEKFKENNLAINKLEKLLEQDPEEKLILPTMYNLYKLYQITDLNKAQIMKKKISVQYPDSRYAQIINNTNPNVAPIIETTESVYNKWYKLFQQEQYSSVLENLDLLISQFTEDEIVPKFELLKANTIAKLKGVTAYKEALQFVADNYPNSVEGKNALQFLTDQIPVLEKMDFNLVETNNWKILYKVGKKEDNDTKFLEEKLKKVFKENDFQQLSYSYDFYTDKDSFITIHGLNSAAFANNVAGKIQLDKSSQNKQNAIVITNENYKVIQIKKNLDTYLLLKNQ